MLAYPIKAGRSNGGRKTIDAHKLARETMLDLFGLKLTSTIKKYDKLDRRFQEAVDSSIGDSEQFLMAISNLYDLLDGAKIATKSNIRKAVEKIYIVGLGLPENAITAQIKKAIAAKLK